MQYILLLAWIVKNVIFKNPQKLASCNLPLFNMLTEVFQANEKIVGKIPIDMISFWFFTEITLLL